APLAEYLKALPNDALMLVDDAHGDGVLDHAGQGAIEYAGLIRRRIVQTITLSKAVDDYGGAILGTTPLRRRILDHSAIFVGSTRLTLPLANAALQAIKILKTDKSLRPRLSRNTDYLKLALRAAASLSLPVRRGVGRGGGFPNLRLSAPGPIIP